jgi:hypothetical protein
MASHLRPHVHEALTAARAARRRGDRAAAWHALERAHILSQPVAWLHTRVHLAMLRAALSPLDAREFLGQLIRLAVAGLGSALGRYPAGNTGRARVRITKPMPVPADLVHILSEAATRSSRLPVVR